MLQGNFGKGKRQLDCAGVVTTTLAALQRLAVYEEHSDLQRCRLQVSSLILTYSLGASTSQRAEEPWLNQVTSTCMGPTGLQCCSDHSANSAEQASVLEP